MDTADSTYQPPFWRRHRLALILAVSLVLCFLLRDRLSLGSASPNRLRFVHSFTTASEREIVDSVVAEFQTAHPGYEIDQIVFNSETYQTIGWRLQFQGERQSDIFFTWQGFKTKQAIDAGWAMDLTPFLSPGTVDQFVPATVGRRDDRIYLLPQSVDLSNLIWYNRDWFASNHLAEPTSRADWLRLCQNIRSHGGLALVQGNRDFWPMGNLGAELVGKAIGLDRLDQFFWGRTPATAETLQGLQLFVDLAKSGSLDLPGILAPGSIGALNDLDAKVLFIAGQAAQHPIGSWFTADLKDASTRGELRFTPGVFTVPANLGEKPARTAVITGYQVNSRTRHPKLAVEFLELLLSRKYQARFAELGNLSARRDALEFTTDPIPRQLLGFLAQPAAMIPPPDTGYPPERAAIFYELCSRLLLGRLDLASAADQWNQQQLQLARKEP